MIQTASEEFHSLIGQPVAGEFVGRFHKIYEIASSLLLTYPLFSFSSAHLLWIQAIFLRISRCLLLLDRTLQDNTL